MKDLSKIFLTCLITTSFVISPALANVSPQEIGTSNMDLKDITLEYMYIYGMELYNRGDYDEAAKVFARILELNPYDEQIEDYLRESNPNHPTLKNIEEMRIKDSKTPKKAEKLENHSKSNKISLKDSKNHSTEDLKIPILKPVEKYVHKPVDNVYKEELLALQSEAQRYDQEINYLEGDIQRLKGKIEENSTNNKKRVEALQTEIKASVDQIAKLNDMLKNQDTLIAEYKEKAATAEEKIVERDKDYAEKIHTQTTLLNQHRESLAHFKSRYNDAQHEVNELRNTISLKDSDISLLKLQLAQTKENLDLANARPIAVQEIITPAPTVESASTTHTSRIEIHGDQTVATNIKHYEKLFSAKDHMIATLKDELALLHDQIETLEQRNQIIITEGYRAHPTINVNNATYPYSTMEQPINVIAQHQVAEARLDLIEERRHVQSTEQELATLKERFLDVQHKLNLVKKSVDTHNGNINSIQQNVIQMTE